VTFSPDGGDVTVQVRPVDGGVSVAVVDHGIGIARADRARIFERFYKVDRARAKGGGTGLGLAIARHVVEGHGGTIRVESREGDGSTFTVTIPAVPVAIAEPA
jgi:signal transduction histidine kinase